MARLPVAGVVGAEALRLQSLRLPARQVQRRLLLAERQQPVLLVEDAVEAERFRHPVRPVAEAALPPRVLLLLPLPVVGVGVADAVVHRRHSSSSAPSWIPVPRWRVRTGSIRL